MHFFNPPALMRLVEVVAGEESAEEALAATAEVARRMGRTPVRAADEIGFVANRCARPFSLEALRLLGDRIADHEQIDRICRLGGGFRMGPFELMDLVGIDVNFEVAKSFWEQSFHEPRWQPHPIQARMVAAGRLGRKTGRGYYDYATPAAPSRRPSRHRRPSRERGAGLDRRRRGDRAARASGRCASNAAASTRSHRAPTRWGSWRCPTSSRRPLVELARGEATSAETADAAEAFFTSLGKHVEWVGDAPGLVLGRIVAQLVNEAHFALGAGVATPRTSTPRCGSGSTTRGARSSGARRSEPPRVLAILDALHAELGEERYRAAPPCGAAASAVAEPAWRKSSRRCRFEPSARPGARSARSSCRRRRTPAAPATGASSRPSPKREGR